MAPRYYNPDCEQEIGEFQLGDLDAAWLDNMHLRMFKEIESQLVDLERSRDAPSDAYTSVKKTLDLLERVLKVQCLLRKAYPKRSRLARRSRRRNAVWSV